MNEPIGEGEGDVRWRQQTREGPDTPAERDPCPVERSAGEMSFAEIGRILGISRERVRFIARRAGSDARRLVRHELTCS